MATQAQILANRSNAQKSTGPRTAEGKAVVAQNAVKHGLVRPRDRHRGRRPRGVRVLPGTDARRAGPGRRGGSRVWPRGSSVSPGGSSAPRDCRPWPSIRSMPGRNTAPARHVRQQAGCRRRFDLRAGPRAGLRRLPGAGSAPDVRATDRAQPLSDHGGTQEAQNPPGGGAGADVGAAAGPGERGRREDGEITGGTPVLRSRPTRYADERRGTSDAACGRNASRFILHTSRSIVQNKANFARRPITAKFPAKRDLRRIRLETGPQKQSQFRVRRRFQV